MTGSIHSWHTFVSNEPIENVSIQRIISISGSHCEQLRVDGDVLPLTHRDVHLALWEHRCVVIHIHDNYCHLTNEREKEERK